MSKRGRVRWPVMQRACVAGLLVLTWVLQASAGVAPAPDVNGDGIVNAIDIAIVGRCLGRNPHNGDCSNADVDHDGDVDVSDLQIVVRSRRRRRPTATRTATPLQETATATATDTPVVVPTDTPVIVPTDTPRPSAIPTPTATNSPVPSATGTATPLATVTAPETGVPTETATQTPTDTPTSTATATVTQTASASFTSTGTPTATFTPTQTATNTSTRTNPPLPSFTPVPTLTHTPTTIPSNTPINTSTQTPTSTVDAGLPPDPVDVAPPVDQSVVTAMQAATAFLYTGANPIQTGVAPGTIDPQRAAVLRGKVMDRNNAPLAGVQITILDHPEFGQTLTRADGMFDLAVNGGGPLTVNYEKAGFLPAQRQVDPPWGAYAYAADVVLTVLDSQVTVVDLTANVPVQVAQGSVVSDADGSRQATVLVPQGTTATMMLADGTMQSLSTLSIRATEYTVGANGPAAMPAELPPTSAYTYAVELSADEALAAGAAEVQFSSPLPFYVENFLGFPIGTTVPLGGYDRTRGVWVAANSGTVIKILSVTGGLADVDLDGNGIADGSAALAALSITDPERQQLALLYSPGQSFWRVLIPHFSPWDCNWPFEPPPDAIHPDQDPDQDEHVEDDCTTAGSIIECQNQTLGEVVDVPGTPFRLHYQSDRVPGHKESYSLEIPLSGPDPLPASLRRIELEVLVVGRVFRQSFAAVENLRIPFTWDGKDVYGRTVQGLQDVIVRVGYTYGGVYSKTGRFGYNGNGTISGSRTRQEVTLWRVWQGLLGAWDARGNALGGWTLNAHHTYDPVAQVLYRGDGTRQGAQTIGPTIRTVAGPGNRCSAGSIGDGGPATKASLCGPAGVAVGSDGSFYIVEFGRNRVRRVAPNGVISTFAGTGQQQPCLSGPCGDGGPATLAPLSSPRGIAIGPDGSLYIDESRQASPFVNATRIVRRIGPDGIITTFAGSGIWGSKGDGGPATQAQFSASLNLAVGPDGSVYIADVGNARIRRVGTDGIIDTVVPSVGVGAIAVGGDGSLYFTIAMRVRRMTPDGIISTIAGTGQGCSPGTATCGDGGPATQAVFVADGIAVDRYDNVYLYARSGRIRWFRPGGTIATLAGTGIGGTAFVEGAPARSIQLDDAVITGSVMAVGPDASVYIAQTRNTLQTVRRISPLAAPSTPGGLAVPDPDGAQVHLFDLTGRHLRTLDALTAALRNEFTYDGAGRLAAITDGDGNVTTIERDAAGDPTGIVAPFGQRTTLATNADDFLDRVTSPAGELMQFAYTTDGLLTDMTNARGHTSRYGFDPMGRLTSAMDPTNATKTLIRSGTNRDYTVALTSPLGRTTTYRVEHLATGDMRLTHTDAAAAQAQILIGNNGRQTASLADGTTITAVLGPDPRWQMWAPVVRSMTVTTPSGQVFTGTSQRAVTLASPTDLLSLATFAETLTINGRAFTRTYNATTRTFSTNTPMGGQTTSVVDVRGRPSQSQFSGLAASSFSYDLRGRLASMTQGNGAGSRTSTFAYDVNGFLGNVTDAAGRSTDIARDANGRSTELTFPDGTQSHFTYDANGNLTSLAPPGRPDHGFAHTQNNQVASYTAPMVGAENNQTLATYDADRLPMLFDRPDGQALAMQYDNAGRLSLMDVTVGDRRFSYDAAGQLATVERDGGPTLTYTYDGGLPIDTIWSGPVAGAVSRVYDNNFRVTSLSLNGANAVALTYNLDGLPIQVGALTLTRHAQTGFITGTALGAVSDTTVYDVFGVPASYSASQGGSTIYAATYTRDALGRIATKSETIAGTTHTFAYTYDLAGRLMEVREDNILTASYDYDSNGNRLSRTDSGGTLLGTYDAQDRLEQLGATSYVHNAAGERQSKTAAGQTTSYQYDTQGNLTGVTLPDATQIEYVLDGAHRRVGKKRNGTLVQGFLYQDGLRPIAELDGSNNVISRFVYADDINVAAYMIRAGVTHRIITDHLGSPRLVIDVATGNVTQRMEYDEFGNVILDTNPGFQPFGFAGGIYDPDTKLVRFGARDYDAETGRWTAKDPIGFDGGPNMYEYAEGDPVNLIDPFGEQAEGLGRIVLRGGWTYTTNVVRNGLIHVVHPRVIPRAALGLPRVVSGLRVAQGGFANPHVLVGLASFTAGFAIGTYLNRTFCLSDRISDFLIDMTQLDPSTEHALQQFAENRGGDIGLRDIADFTQRCTGGGISAFCAGFAPR